MNERIKELAEEALDKSVPETWSTLTHEQLSRFQEKFAELIIAECCVALHPMLRDMISRTQGVDLIVKHFGVE
jgi:hypothetical protein